MTEIRPIEKIQIWFDQKSNEELLINQRLTWLLGVNGFLVASYAIIGTYLSNLGVKASFEVIVSTIILGAVGIFIANVSRKPIGDALYTIDLIRRELEKFRRDDRYADLFYAPRGENFHEKSWAYARRIPVVLCCMWIALLATRLTSVIAI